MNVAEKAGDIDFFRQMKKNGSRDWHPRRIRAKIHLR